MRPILLFLLLPLLTQAQLVVPGIIPAPAELTLTNGECRMDRPWKLTGTTPEAKTLTEFLSTEVSAIFSAYDPISGTPLPITLQLVAFDTLVPEGYYSLRVEEDRITITSNRESGLFYGTRTLIQLLEIANEQGSIPCLTIVDHPRFSWRGMHLDVVRHFFPVEFVKKYIDLLARYKMNSFHWHLTDDQGWRIEIKQYPKLTEIGGWRSGSQIGPYSRLEYDTIPYGGSYTQDEIREVVAYAAARHINVVPEIEMPGHALAALAAYPELGCTGGPYEVEKGWGVFEEVFCPTDTTIRFLENVLTEVMELFPGPIIHIGGDECPKESWKVCAHCQQLMKEEGLKDEHELQSYFIQRIERFVNSKGRKIIGWDEILEGGLAPNAAVMSWRGTEGGVTAAKSGHDAVMSPGSHCYFDHYQGDPANEPLAFGGYTTVQKVYSYEPVPNELNAEQAKHILGAQGNIWTEYILSPEHVEYMALPRMAALAEVLWTPKEMRNEGDFIKRLELEFLKLEAMKINASRSLYQVGIRLQQGQEPGSIDCILQNPFGSKHVAYKKTGMTTLLEGDEVLSFYTEVTGLDPDHIAVFAEDETITIQLQDSDSTLFGTSSYPLIKRTFHFNKATAQKITLSAEPNDHYNEGGAFTLVDGITAQEKRVNTEWLGWKEDVVITIDLGSEQDISFIGIGALDETHSWIHLPEQVVITTSLDGKDYTAYGKVETTTANSGRMELGNEMAAKARYVRLIIKHKGIIPDGFPGAGNPSWLFLDEITVR